MTTYLDEQRGGGPPVPNHQPTSQTYSGQGPGQPHINLPQTQYPSHFGTIPAQGPWLDDERMISTSNQILNLEGAGPSYMRIPLQHTGPSPQIRHDTTSLELTTNPSNQSTDSRQEENRRRTAAREVHRPYLREMAAAHAQNRDPHIEIPVCPSGTVLGLKSPWHRAARLFARQTFNFKVRSYKAKREYWNSQVEIIAQKLAQKFTYSRHLDIAYLGKFLKNTLKNDRKLWKKHFIKTSGMRHPQCPMEAFIEWKKYWMSAAGREESIQMTEMRKGKRKAHSLENDRCSPLAPSNTPNRYMV